MLGKMFWNESPKTDVLILLAVMNLYISYIYLNANAQVVNDKAKLRRLTKINVIPVEFLIRICL